MVNSMTGYGRVEQAIGDKNIIVEIKALNGKQFDINCKISQMVKPFEIELRKEIQEKLVRGSVDCNILVLQAGSSRPMQINTELAKSYYHSIHQLAADLNLDTNNILQTVMSLPEVVGVENTVLGKEDWNALRSMVHKAIAEVMAFRAEEGAGLEKELMMRVDHILTRLDHINTVDSHRNEKIRERILKSLQGISDEVVIDENRMEQELIYYIEKIDIAEEKQRLRQHCELFKETILQGTQSGIGKKLNFVLQEMGREINTLGSKAYDAGIQKTIIEMKDELEKAKEQSLNVL